MLDSPSAVQGSFDSYIDNDGVAEDGASCSRNRTGRSSGWTSSEDETDATEQDDEGSALPCVYSNFVIFTCLEKSAILYLFYIYVLIC